jgi:hypothetical protein
MPYLIVVQIHYFRCRREIAECTFIHFGHTLFRIGEKSGRLALGRRNLPGALFVVVRNCNVFDHLNIVGVRGDLGLSKCYLKAV